MLKQFLLVALTSVAALVFWMVTKPLIVGPVNFQETFFWLWPLTLLVILAGLMALSFLLLEPKIIWLVMALNLIIFALLFNPKEITIWGGVALAFFFQFSAREITRKEKNNRLRFNFPSIVWSGVGRLITSILILISLAYFLSSGAQATAQKKELPGAVRQVVEVVVGSYIGENLEGQNPRLRAQATEAVLQKINNFFNPYFVYLPPIFAFSLFLILQGLSIIFIWLAVLWAWLIFWILKLLKIVRIEKEPKEAEVINF